MTAVPARVAVHPGTGTVRVAGATRGGPARMIAELPACRWAAVPELFAALFGEPVEELVLLHPAGWPAARVARWAAGAAGLATTVRTEAAAVAAAATAAGPVAVLDVGQAGAEAVLVDGGEIVAVRTGLVGGAVLDDLVGDLLLRRWGAPAPGAAVLRAEARRVREALSLQPVAVARLPGVDGGVRLEAAELRAVLAGPLGTAVDVLRAVLVAAPGPRPAVRVVGGVARTPLLAELLDAAGIEHVVAPRPDACAVLGALRGRPGLAHPTRTSPRARHPRGRAGRSPAPGSPPASPARTSPAGGPRLPPLPRRRPLRAAAIVTSGAAAAALLAAGLPAAAVRPEAAVPTGVLVQYGYSVVLPAGWAHTGGLPERRRSLLTPQAGPDGSDLISVERTPLGYDTGAEPERALAELRTVFDAEVAAGAPLSGFTADGRFAGRPVVSYRQSGPGVAVDWYVVLDADAQLSVGCRHTAAGAATVAAACEAVVGSVRRDRPA